VTIAWTSDRILSSQSVRAGRRRNFIAAMAILSLLILFAPVVDDLWELLLVLTLVLTGSTTGAGLNFTLASDLLRNPADVSRVIAITALGGNLFGLIAPIITGYVVAATGGYSGAFGVAAVLLVVGAIATLTMTRKPIEPEFDPTTDAASLPKDMVRA
jgi:ACS family glucarate transporter-like MFS transporter